MKKTIFLILAVLLLLWGSRLQAAPTTSTQAKNVVRGWLKANVRPLRTTLGRQITNVDTFSDDNNQPVYYVIYLQPSGFVIVPADDLVEPIIAFVPKGWYDPSPDNPLGALVGSDLPARLSVARAPQTALHLQAEEKNLTKPLRTLKKKRLKAQSKWAQLENYAHAMQLTGLPIISDVWVAPLVESKWAQTTVNGLSCYNYYTPPYEPDTPSNYPCGCVATVLAQLMRFHEHPVGGIGEHSFVIEVDSVPETAWTRGGDGGGGPYDWTQMVLVPDSSTTTTQRQAIGSVCYDAGISVNMHYASSQSGTDLLKVKDALTTTFDYSSAIKGYNEGSDIGPALNEMVNPNLDFNHPVILGITGPSGGHAVIADGYGYDFSTLYHHLNMGWAGDDDAWYNLPNIDPSPSFTSVNKCIYNIFISGSGEIISGRVVDANEDPISEATVTAQGPGDPNSTVTNGKGIYALANLSPTSTYTIGLSKDGYTFEPPKAVATAVSGGASSGNRWAVNFQGISGQYPVIHTIPDQVEFSVMAGDPDPEPQILCVRNSGFGTLNWVINYDCNWLEVDPCEGILTGDINEVTLSVDTTGMALGSYDCQLTISDPCAFNSPKTIQVNLAIWAVLHVPTEEYPTIQAAIDAAADGCTIIVSEGTHAGLGNRDIDFLGKAITVRSTNPNDPDIVAATIIDCSGTQGEPHRGFYFHTAEGQSSVLDGLTITNGYAYDDDGGGIFCVGASPTIRNCTISNSQAGNIGSGLYNYGGGISNKDGSCPTLINCTISGNSAQYGGGMHNRFSNPMLINCNFTDNSARYAGAMYNYESNPTVTNCDFIGNSAYYAGGVYVRADSNATFTNCTFTGNFGDSKGGGIYNKGITTLTSCTFTGNTGEFRAGGMNNEGTATLTNCTFRGNAASASNGNGGGISTFSGSSTLKNCTFNGNFASFYGGGAYCQNANLTMINCTFTKNSVGRHGKALATNYASQVQLTNCILWDGGDEIYDLAGGSGPSTITVTYSDVKGGFSGTGNIDTNPCFVTGPLGDYYLSQIAAGQAENSPCVDAGSDTATNLGMDVLTTRTDSSGDKGIVDMGYHYPAISADIDRNWYVDLLDFAVLAADWLRFSDPDWLAGDITKDGCVDINDLAILADYWLYCYVAAAGNPSPINYEPCVEPNVVLSWTAGEGALYHDVYFGTDVNAVANASHQSAEFMGTVPDANFDPCTLDLHTRYYWRVDEIGSACSTAGNIWCFTTLGIPDHNLVSWWQFEEGQGSIAYDSAGNGNNDGTVYGAQWTTGKIGNWALDFDGVSNYVEIANNSSLTPHDKITISFWLYNRGGQNAGIYKYASCPDVAGSPGKSRAYYVQVSDSTGKAQLKIFSSVGTYDDIVSNGVVSLNDWHHIAARFYQGQAAIYIDGQLDNSTTMSVSSIMDDAHPLTIGGYWDYCSGDNFVSRLNGTIDDVRIYNGALSGGQIQQLYQEGLN